MAKILTPTQDSTTSSRRSSGRRITSMIILYGLRRCISCFFFNDTATTEIYTLSLHDALPISDRSRSGHRIHDEFAGTRVPADEVRGATGRGDSVERGVARIRMARGGGGV